MAGADRTIGTCSLSGCPGITGRPVLLYSCLVVSDGLMEGQTREVILTANAATGNNRARHAAGSVNGAEGGFCSLPRRLMNEGRLEPRARNVLRLIWC